MLHMCEDILSFSVLSRTNCSLPPKMSQTRCPFLEGEGRHLKFISFEKARQSVSQSVSQSIPLFLSFMLSLSLYNPRRQKQLREEEGFGKKDRRKKRQRRRRRQKKRGSQSVRQAGSLRRGNLMQVGRNSHLLSLWGRIVKQVRLEKGSKNMVLLRLILRQGRADLAKHVFSISPTLPDMTPYI